MIESPLLARIHGLCLTDRCLKRALDLACSSLGLIGLGWLILLCAALARWHFAGTGICSQIRVGRHGKRFSLYTIRTEAASFEGSSTPVQKRSAGVLSWLLLKTGAYALPQLWNVWRGDMSLVGPEPFELRVANRLRGADLLLITVRPGMTGPAGLHCRSDRTTYSLPKAETSDVLAARTRISRRYIQQYRLRDDLQCMWRGLMGGQLVASPPLPAALPRVDQHHHDLRTDRTPSAPPEPSFGRRAA